MGRAQGIILFTGLMLVAPSGVLASGTADDTTGMGSSHISPAETRPDPVKKDRPRDWARGTAIFGIIASVLIETSWVLSDVIRVNRYDPGCPHPIVEPYFVIPATVLTIASIPVVAAGSAWARRRYQVGGFPRVRVAGWVLYAISVSFAAAMMVVSATNYRFCDRWVPYGIMPGLGSLGALSAVLMSVDGLGASRQAQEVLKTTGVLTVLHPYVTSFHGGAMAGLRGTF